MSFCDTQNSRPYQVLYTIKWFIHNFIATTPYVLQCGYNLILPNTSYYVLLYISVMWNTCLYTICITLNDMIYTVLLSYHTLSWRQKN